jgi:hypothetical protein
MRYIWAFIAYLALLAAAVMSCGGAGNTNSGPGGSGTGAQNSGTGNGSGTGNSTASGMGGGGSRGIGLVGTGTGSGGSGGGSTCPTAMTCAQQGFNCGMASDGCNGTHDCGTCAAGQSCGASSPNVCGTVACTPATCTSLGYNCGMTSNNCNGTLDCGTCPSGETCGATSANVCGMGTCTAATCTGLGFNCGTVGNNCGGTLDCGTCPSGQTCGANNMANQCGTPVCVKTTCAAAGATCGQVADGCGGVLSCGFCASPQTCGGGGTPYQCGTGTACTGLCLQQQTCPVAGVTTTLTGTVYAPNGTDPLTTALVYIPNAPVTAFPCGVTCGSCSAGVSGSPLVSAVTGINGQFTLTNVPVGANIPLVIQLGRWRRQVTIANVPACVTTPVPVTLTNMPNCRTSNASCPAGKAKGDIPLMAFATGSVDGLECVMHKIGVDETEFTVPAANCGGGRIQLFTGITSDGFGDSYGGATIGGTGMPTEDKLWTTQATLNDYDMVLFPCQGAENDSLPDAAVKNVVNYANAGGRIFGTHYSYDWFTNVNPASTYVYPFAATAAWVPDAADANAPENQTQIGYINQTAGTDSLTLAQWLFQPAVGASTTLGQIEISVLRHDFDSVVAPSLLWMSIKNDPIAGNAPMHYTFNTPIGTPPAMQCGRVVYDDFHVEDTENILVTPQTAFPQECSFTACTTSAQCVQNPNYGTGSTCTGGLCMTPQEKLLEFMLFDLASCVTTTTGSCTPKTCANFPGLCGVQGDGCGGVTANCGTCGVGETCGGGGTPSQCGMPSCTPKTCMQLGFNCGPQGDGCGNILTCGTCVAPLICGYTTPNQCGSPSNPE